MKGLTARAHTRLAAALIGTALAAWIVSVQRMRGMDAGPGTDLGTLGWFLGIWVTMMAAMMLPSVTPTVLLVARTRPAAQVWAFVTGYLLAWAGYGLVAYAVYRAVAAGPWEVGDPWIVGGALAAAGLYQLTPLKAACLRRCRSPLQLLVRGRPGAAGAARMGATHGAHCVGCCAFLMVALFALGVMSLFWMAVVTAAIAAEKALPERARAAPVLAGLLVGAGVLVVTSLP